MLMVELKKCERKFILFVVGNVTIGKCFLESWGYLYHQVS